MARSMAVVNTIANVESIPEKDRIVLYGFSENDWKIIDGKDTYKVGDLVVRIEVDSLLPVREEFEFLRSKCYTSKFDRFRIKALKLGGVVSQGLLLNLSILPKGKYKSGDDVTELLDILKMEDAEDASPKANGTSKLQTPFIKFLMDHKLTRKLGKLLIKFKLRNHISGNFPSSTISKTDETILQNYKGLLTKHAKDGSYITLKCEGQSSTFLYKMKKKKPFAFFACSRNIAYPKDNDNNFWKMAKKYKLDEKLRKYFKDTGKVLAIQCEVIGPGVQENIYKLKELEIRMFTAKDITNDILLTYSELIDLRDNYDIPMVPVLTTGILEDILPDLETALRLSFIKKNDLSHLDERFRESLKKETWIPEDVLNEGMVIRGLNNEFSFKVRNPQYVFGGITAKY